MSRFDSPFNSSSGDGESDASYHSIENPSQRDIDISGLPANLTLLTCDDDDMQTPELSPTRFLSQPFLSAHFCAREVNHSREKYIGHTVHSGH